MGSVTRCLSDPLMSCVVVNVRWSCVSGMVTERQEDYLTIKQFNTLHRLTVNMQCRLSVKMCYCVVTAIDVTKAIQHVAYSGDSARSQYKYEVLYGCTLPYWNLTKDASLNTLDSPCHLPH